MWFFKEVERAKVLQGRTITYLAEQKLFITKGYLTSILNGKRGCSTPLANNIANCISYESKITDYFYRKEK